MLRQREKADCERTQETKAFEKNNRVLRRAVGRRTALERAVGHASMRFALHGDLDTVIDGALQDIGQAVGADRACLCLFRDGHSKLGNTYEWCAPGVRPKKEGLRNLACDRYSWWTAKLRRGEAIHVPDVAAMPEEASAEREILLRQDIRSTLAFPVHLGRLLIGFVGIDNVDDLPIWSDGDTAVLGVGAKIIGAALEREQAGQARDRERAQLLAVFESMEDMVYVADPTDDTIEYVNKAVQDRFGEAVGKKCHEVFRNTEHRCTFCPDPLIFGEHLGEIRARDLYNEDCDTWYRCVAQAVRWTDERLMRLEIVHDITAHKQQEQALREALGSLEHSNTLLRRTVSATFEALGKAVDLRDPYTAGHQRGVSQLARALAIEMSLDADTVEGISTAAVVHDIGKLGIPTEILAKPGPLSQIEYSIIQTHSEMGQRILESIETQWPVATIVAQHHERLNGSGYPNRLAGDDICLGARIVAVADVVDAMTSHRPYRSALAVPVALEEIERNSGILYDPEVVRACLRLFNERGWKQLDETCVA